MELHYEPAMESDAEMIFKQCKALVDAYETVSDIDYQGVLAWIFRKIKENIDSYTKVICDGKTVGYYFLRAVGDKLELDDFYILEEYRGRGIGSVVLQDCLCDINQTVFLYVFVKNTGAIRLYQRYGFQKVKDVGSTRWIMERNPDK